MENFNIHNNAFVYKCLFILMSLNGGKTDSISYKIILLNYSNNLFTFNHIVKHQQ